MQTPAIPSPSTSFSRAVFAMELANVITGVHCTLIFLLFAPTQIALLSVLRREKRLVYKLMFHNGLVELLVLSTTFMAGLMTLSQSVFFQLFPNVVEALLTSGKVGMVFAFFLVALYRLRVVFSISLKREKLIFNILIISMWSATLALFCTIKSMQPNKSVYNLKTGLFTVYIYAASSLAKALFWIHLTLLVLTSICYAIMCASFMMARFHYTSKVSVNTAEVKLFVQAIVTTLIFGIVDQYGCQITQCTVGINAFYVIVIRTLPVMNTLFYLAIHKGHRNKVLNYFGLKKKPIVIYVVPLKAPNTPKKRFSKVFQILRTKNAFRQN
ncbi:hypothetical protein QR680_009829 [Steinernema hermaphroditum]|uniref:Uncharacterized protein n=1 Tax=Steinernema hermaphroditum TaxID=289476 RepID=A0AA39IN51_9BILA|nr:hypothetical protein QR680_009829 [Steinernema hermaphroditum]